MWSFSLGHDSWKRTGMRWLLLLLASLLAVLVFSAPVPSAGKVIAAPVTDEGAPAYSSGDDSERLLQLANQLKSEMDKTTKDELSVSVLRKAEAIEKLARRMRTQ